MNPEINDKDDENDEEILLDNATQEITKGAGGAVVGCVFASVFLIIFSIPILIMLLISPSSSVLSQICVFQTKCFYAFCRFADFA